MSALDDFIIAADQLIDFYTNFQEIPLVDQTSGSLEAFKIEVKDLWCNIKRCYSLCLRADDTSVQDDLDAIKSKYRLSSNTYINCLSEIIESAKKLSAIECDTAHNISRGVSHHSLPQSVNDQKSDNNQNSSAEASSSLVPPKDSRHISSIGQTTLADSASPVPYIKVPPCDTETFYGDYLTWPSFRDMFTAVYINHPKLCSVQKLFHLRAKTKEEANNIVSKFPLTAENFDLAWKALSDQYENRRILVNNQLKNLFNLPTITLESGKNIKELQREVNDCLSILQAHNVDISTWDPILIYLCSNRLPERTLSLWEQSIKSPRDIPSWAEMDSFLTNRYRVLETVSDIKCSPGQKRQSFKNPIHSSKRENQHKAFHTKSSNFNCKLCKSLHPLRLCPKFAQMSVRDRISKVNSLKYCTNCLSSTHLLSECQSVHTCMQCKQRHHTLLHTSDSSETHNTPYSPRQRVSQFTTNSHTHNDQDIQSTQNQNSLHVQSYFARNNKRVLLATALIDIHHQGSSFTLRALLDPGSEVTFISEVLQRKLDLPVKPIHAQISGMSSVVTATASKLCTLRLGSKYISTFSILANAIVLKRLTSDLPTCTIRQDEISQPIDIELADPYFYESSKIDLVIGADLYPSIIKEGVKPNIFGSLVAQNTVFGWVLSGPLPQESCNSFSTVLSFFSEISLDQQIAKFWEIEEILEPKPLSDEDRICEEAYQKTTSRDSNGRYVVCLPFKNPMPTLGYSRDIALKQLNRLEKSLQRDPDLHSKYNQVLEEYSVLGHMEIVSPKELIRNEKICSYYLPHHAVTKPDSITTKTRVVFNASNPSSNGVSLNDVLYTGPVLQTDLTTLILKWRFYRFVFNADIEKMYRQILVHPDHVPYQRILFRKLANSDVQDYELKTVTFGVNCAPYLAIRTLLQLADDVQYTFPFAAAILRNDFYVDDVLSGAHDLNTALKAQKELNEALSSAGFSLRKWTSNCFDLIKGFPSTQLYDQEFLKLEDRSISKTLGIQWNAKQDSFHFFFKISERDAVVTKRTVLSIISQLFDPAGWLAPVLITAKIIMQQIWRDGTSWDSPIKPLTCHRWKSFFATLPDIHKIKVQRWVRYDPRHSIQIHGFCDASEKAYAATFYLRVQHNENTWSSHLLCAKSKVAPVKVLPLPRLELCGALLLSKLFNKVIAQLPCSNQETLSLDR